jgi:hypothetical protein
MFCMSVSEAEKMAVRGGEGTFAIEDIILMKW